MIAYFDIFSGISGDMTLGALIDLGVPVSWLETQIKDNILSGFKIESEVVQKNGLSAQNVIIESLDNNHGRDYKKIKSLIINSNLSDKVKALSLDAFKKIAVAESEIHSRNIDHVHFHEVGSVDAIVDIIGSFLCIEYLNIDKVYASKISLGSGFVDCSHGTIPVPAPATLSILNNVPIRPHDATSDIDSSEIVTPTGAAIITTLTSEFGKIPEMKLGKVGYGSGKRDSGSKIPNLLRVITGNGEVGTEGDQVYVIETTVDDMPQEYSGYIFDKLFHMGALDVCHIPVQMKKNRPGVRLEILSEEKSFKKIIDFVFTQSTTTGIRYYKAERIKLEREIVEINTRFGRISAKKILRPDLSSEIIPEYEELRKIADTTNIPLKIVYNQVNLDIQAM